MSDHRRRGEIAAVVATGLLFLLFENVLHAKVPFLIACVLGWSAYLVVRVRRDRSLLAEWGIRRDNLKPALFAGGALLAIGAIAIGGYRWFAGWSPLPRSSLLLFAVYPVWGFLQQFFVQALVARNLDHMGVRRWILIPVAAALFGLAHAPDWILCGLCAGAGLAWTAVYLRTRNLIPLAFVHAWLGTLTYHWILERDPWGELFRPGP